MHYSNIRSLVSQKTNIIRYSYSSNFDFRILFVIRIRPIFIIHCNTDYNQETQRDSELLERTKKEIHEEAATIIKMAEESHLKKQEERHTKMSEALNSIQEVLTELDLEEKELCKFASCLSQLQANVKSPKKS